MRNSSGKQGEMSGSEKQKQGEQEHKQQNFLGAHTTFSP